MALLQCIEDATTGEQLHLPDREAAPRKIGPCTLRREDFALPASWVIDPRWLGRSVYLYVGGTEASPGVTRWCGYFLDSFLEDELCQP